MTKYKYTNKIVEVKLDYVYISCDVMINIYSEIKEKDFDVDLGWIFDLHNQIEWSLGILKNIKINTMKNYKINIKKLAKKWWIN